MKSTAEAWVQIPTTIWPRDARISTHRNISRTEPWRIWREISLLMMYMNSKLKFIVKVHVVNLHRRKTIVVTFFVFSSKSSMSMLWIHLPSMASNEQPRQFSIVGTSTKTIANVNWHIEVWTHGNISHRYWAKTLSKLVSRMITTPTSGSNETENC